MYPPARDLGHRVGPACRMSLLIHGHSRSLATSRPSGFPLRELLFPAKCNVQKRSRQSKHFQPLPAASEAPFNACIPRLVLSPPHHAECRSRGPPRMPISPSPMEHPVSHRRYRHIAVPSLLLAHAHRCHAARSMRALVCTDSPLPDALGKN